ncbi:MAG: GNAT family N-acetyltransferase [Candidatus Latescibacteria bacterium]|nr:GNAT family N-acetyltransferase [Candidatus Latescibacterota bacterium]
MNVDGFNVIALDREKHREALAAISSRMTERHVDWETSRVGLIDNTMVTNWGVFEITLRIGTARVKAAGVDCVETHSEYRKLGLMRKTALSSLEAMRQNGYDISLLLGIEHSMGVSVTFPAGRNMSFMWKWIISLPKSWPLSFVSLSNIGMIWLKFTTGRTPP